MVIFVILLGLPILLLLLLLATWLILSKNNKPLPQGIRKVFSTQYSYVVRPIAYFISVITLLLSFFSFGTWSYFKNTGFADITFIVIGVSFLVASIDMLMAVTINKKYQIFD